VVSSEGPPRVRLAGDGLTVPSPCILRALHFVPEDIPGAVSNVLKEADLVFVFVLFEEMDYKIQALLNKLIDLEMKDETKIVKVIEESELGNVDEMRLEREKHALAEKRSKFILDY